MGTQNSNILCKIISFLAYWLPAVSAHLVAFISIQRFMSILFTNKSRFLTQSKIQLAITLIVMCVNTAIYSSFLVFYGTFTYSAWLETNQNTTEYEQSAYAALSGNNSEYMFCDVINKQTSKILSILDALNSAIIPFIIMFICSFLTIYSIFRSRNRLARNLHNKELSKHDVKRLKRDISFSVTSLSLNFIFIFFTLPICIYLALISDPNYTKTILYLILDDLYYMGYSVSVIVYSISNRMFRNELKLFLKEAYHLTL